MKYMEKGGFQTQSLMRWTLGLTCALLAFFWLTNLVLFLTRLGWTPSSIAAYYLGSDADFRPPRTFGSMIEVTHAHLPMMALVMLLLTHLMIFAPYSKRAKVWMIVGAFLSAFASEASGYLVRFVHPAFAWVKLLAFVSLQGILGFLIVGLVLFLRAGRGENGLAERRPAGRPPRRTRMRKGGGGS